jgi:hypothetical protein
VSTFLTPSVWPKFCVRRNDEKGDEPTGDVFDVVVWVSIFDFQIYPAELAGIDENRTDRIGLSKNR